MRHTTSRAGVRTGIVSATVLAVVGSMIGTAALSAPANAAQTAVFIDAGATAPATGPDGTSYAASTGFTGGRAGTVPSGACTGALGSSILKTTWVGMTAWSAPVLNGTYSVTLVMSENYWTAAGKRAFSATAEGVPVVTKLDLFATAGARTEVDRTVTVTVADGTLDLAFTATTDKAIVSAIRVVPVAGPTPTPSPTTPSVTPTPTPSPTSPSVTPTPTPTPTPTGSNLTKLRYAPPALTNPVSVTLSASNRKPALSLTQDYIIKMPAGPVDWAGGVEINGGRNIVIIGGTCAFSKDYATSSQDEGVANRCLYIKGNAAQTAKRTIHIEGVRASGDFIYEFLNIDSQSEPGLTVQLESIRVDWLKSFLPGPTAPPHYGGDAVQDWNGPTNIYVDRFTLARSDYQGFFGQGDKYGTSPHGVRQYNNMNLVGGPKHTYLLTGNTTFDFTATNVWVKPGAGNTWSNTVGSGWSSVAKQGNPGDFVTADDAGVGYVSPGYGA